MKNVVLVFAILTLSISGFSQMISREKAKSEIVSVYSKTSVEFFLNELGENKDNAALKSTLANSNANLLKTELDRFLDEIDAQYLSDIATLTTEIEERVKHYRNSKNLPQEYYDKVHEKLKEMKF